MIPNGHPLARSKAPFAVGDRIKLDDGTTLSGRPATVTSITYDGNEYSGWTWMVQFDGDPRPGGGWQKPSRWAVISRANTGGTDMEPAIAKAVASKANKVDQVLTWRDFRDVLRKKGECPCGGTYGVCTYHP